MLYGGIFALVGAVIGAFASIFSVWFSKRMLYSGKISMYAKIVGSRIDSLHRTWGIRKSDKGPSFHIPMWLEICNTSGVSRIIRNVNLHIILNNSVVSFTQFQGNSNDSNAENSILLGNQGAYTFVVPGNSALRVNLEFGLLEADLSQNQNKIDSIYITYYDEKNRVHTCHLANVDFDWSIGELPRIKNWIALKEIKYKKLSKLIKKSNIY